MDVALGGNVGGGIAPAASELALRDTPPSWYVLEMSSFQLADTETFAPQIGVLTNLAPDHLDRYSDVGSYFADKAKLFANARPSDLWVLNGEDPEALRLPGNAAGKRHLFCYDAPSAPAGSTTVGSGAASRVPSAFLRNEILTLRVEEGSDPGAGEEALIPRDDLPLLGRHNVMNALAASLAARLAGAGVEGIREGLRSFRALPHRLEKVGDRSGVIWVNDSKATNVAATESALRSLDGKIVLLLGGKDKGEDFRPLGRALHGRVRTAVLFGEAAARLEVEVGEGLREGTRAGRSDPSNLDISAALTPSLVRVDDGFDVAVATAEAMASAGDLLLLSPACSSFDEFDGYESRGRRFSELAHQGAMR
jgi:UDP-N-acetylmuramoylalanine--D-glutamate ligase